MTLGELRLKIIDFKFGHISAHDIDTALDAYTKALLQQDDVSRGAAILDRVKVKCRIENNSIIVDLSV